MDDCETEGTRSETLATFVKNAGADKHKVKGLHYNSDFSFCNDVLTRSRIKPWIISATWILVIFLIDLSLLFNTVPLSEENDGYQITTSVSGLLIQQIGFISAILNFIFLIYQVYLWLGYKITVGLSSLQASLLYYSFVYLPYISSCFCGFIFGRICLGSFLGSVQYLFLASGVTLSFFLLAVSQTIFYYVAQFSISIENSRFAAYDPVLKSSDLLFIFIISAFSPFRNSRVYQYSTISCILMISWGLYKLATDIRLPFINNLGLCLLQRVFLDAILLGILGIVWIWHTVGYQLEMEISILALAFNALIECVIMKTIFIKTNKVFFGLKNQIFDESMISRPQTALLYLRSGISYQIERAVNPEFLKYIMKARFSEHLLADVMKICIIRNIPLSEIEYYPQEISKTYQTRLRFLATQVYQYQRTQLSDDSPEVTEILSVLQKESAQLIGLTEVFWTERDHRQRSLKGLGEDIKRTNMAYKRALSYFPNSIAIHNAWVQYAENVLCASDKAKSKSNKEVRINPLDFKLEREVHKKREIPPVRLSSTEAYIDSVTNKVTRPFRVLIALVGALFVVIFLGVNIYYYYQLSSTKSFLYEYENVLRMPLALTYKVLYEAELRFNIPVYTKIMKILGLNSVDATNFRGKFELQDEAFTNSSQYLRYIPLKAMSTSLEGCTRPSLSLLATMDISRVAMVCLTRWYMDSVRWIEIYMKKMIDSQEPPTHVIRCVNIVTPIVATVVVIIGSVVIFITTRDRYIHLLNVVRQITASKKQRSESTEPDFSLSPLFLAVMWIIAATSVFAYAHMTIIRALQINKEPVDLLVYATYMSTITQKAWSSMALAEQVISGNSMMDELKSYASNFSLAIIECTRRISIAGVVKRFKDIYPVSQWDVPETDSFAVLVLDFANMMNDFEFTQDDFRLMMSRFFMKYNLTSLVTNTLPQMLDAIDGALDSASSNIWNVSMVFLTIIIVIIAVLHQTSKRHKVWLSAVKYLVRREMSVSHAQQQKVLQMVEKGAPSLVERIPQPAFVLGSAGTILECNELGARLVGLTVYQMAGQQFEDVFGERAPVKTLLVGGNNMTLKFVGEPFDDDKEIVFVIDITKRAMDEEKEAAIVKIMKPDAGELPKWGRMIVITAKIEATNENIETSMKAFDECDEQFPDITRISAGPNHYRGVCELDQAKSAVGFCASLLEKIGTFCAAVITEGDVVICGVVDGDAICIVAGEPSIRGTDVALDCAHGRCCIDYSILEKDFSLSDLFSNKDCCIPISPIHR